MFDIVIGRAGLILSLLSLWKDTTEEPILELAKMAAEQLRMHAQEDEQGSLAWKHCKGFCFLGFSHGIAGITYSLLKLGNETKQPNFLETVKRALAFERRHFCSKKKNWPRFSDKKEPTFPVQWCHGAVGVGFGRLASLPFLQDEEIHQEITTSVELTRKTLLSNENITLCCGECGKWEFLRSASVILPELKDLLRPTISSLIHQYKKQTRPYFDPSFMQGASGFGYTLLRAIDKDNILPQVLLLE